MSGPAAPAPGGAEPIRPGRHARTEVDLDAVATGSAPVELSLAGPFGALLSALLLERPYRLSKLSLDYVAPGRLSSWATFSAKVRDVRDAGEATVSLLVFKGPRLFVRGEADIVLDAVVGASAHAPSTASTRSGSHLNGESR